MAEPLSLALILAYVTAGFAGGFLGGFMGVGGGIIFVPALDFLFRHAGIATDRAFHLAIGTSLAAILLTSASSARTHHGAGFVAWRAVLWGVIGGAAGSTIAAQIAIGLDQKFLKAAFGVMLFWVASHFLFYKERERASGAERASAPFMAGIGGASGLFAGFFGVGGGILNVPLLILFGRFTPHRAIGTSAALVVFYAGFAAANYAFTGWSETRGVPGTLGFIYLPAWIFMVPASMIAAHFGARAAGRIDPKPLRSIIAVLLALIGVRFVAALFI